MIIFHETFSFFPFGKLADFYQLRLWSRELKVRDARSAITGSALELELC